LKQAREKARPGKVPIRFQPEFAEGLGNVQIKLVGRRILACIVAIAAIVTKVRKVFKVLFRKDSPALHGGENCAKSLTIAACITDYHDPFSFLK